MVNRSPFFLILIFCFGHYVSAISLFNKSPKVNDILSTIEIRPVHDSIKKEEAHPYNYRPLTARDSAVYRMIDSLERADERDKAMRSMEAFISGNISYLIFNIDYRRFLNYNPHEGLRLGLGLSTNQKLASFFSLGGYFSYGIKDEDWKYGSFIQLFSK